MIDQRNIYHVIKGFEKSLNAIYHGGIFATNKKGDIVIYSDMVEKHTVRLFNIGPNQRMVIKPAIIYDENEILDVQYFPYKKREIKSFKIINCDEIDYSKKYLNRESLDNLFEKKEDCDEIIILKNGIITDTSIANIAIFYEAQWLTSKECLLKK